MNFLKKRLCSRQINTKKSICGSHQLRNEKSWRSSLQPACSHVRKSLASRHDTVVLSRCILTLIHATPCSFRHWHIRAFHPTNCGRPQLNACYRRVRLRLSLQPKYLPTPLDSLAVSFSIVAASFGSLIGATYSSFCT